MTGTPCNNPLVPYVLWHRAPAVQPSRINLHSAALCPPA